MPTKRLPDSADINHLKHQAKDLLSDIRNAKMSAFQRLREFHPKSAELSDEKLSARTFTLSDALLAIAREYGYQSWPRLKKVVAEAHGQNPALIHNERIEDEVFCQALDFLDEGNAVLLERHLANHPNLVHRKIQFEGDNYFCEPTLIEFVAENPIRHGKLPENIVEIAKIILKAGAKDNKEALTETAMLVASGRIAREQGAQVPLLNLLCDHGVDPNECMQATLGHGEFEAAKLLLSRGARVDLATAVALDLPEAAKMIEAADNNQLQFGLALAAMHNRATLVPLLLKAGADPNRYNPPGGHSHCTPLHSAAWEGHMDTVTALVEGGARLDIGDIHHSATPLSWAEHAGQDDVAAYLKSKL